MSSLFDDVKARGIPYASHASDLCLPDTAEVRALLAAHNRTAQPFTNQIEGGQWLDVPFAYIPWWEARAKQQAAHCAECGEPWPCSDSKRTDIRPTLRARHYCKV